jgi:hypothetical protein
MRCLYCGNELALLKKLTGHGEFCSEAHRQKYQEQYNRLALTRLLQAQDPDPERRPLQLSTRGGSPYRGSLGAGPEVKQIDSAPAPVQRFASEYPALSGFVPHHFEPALSPAELFSSEPFLSAVTACLPAPAPLTAPFRMNPTELPESSSDTEAGRQQADRPAVSRFPNGLRLLEGNPPVPMSLQRIDSTPILDDSVLSYAFRAEFGDTIAGLLTLIDGVDVSSSRERRNGDGLNGHHATDAASLNGAGNAELRQPDLQEPASAAVIPSPLDPSSTSEEPDAILFESPAANRDSSLPIMVNLDAWTEDSWAPRSGRASSVSVVVADSEEARKFLGWLDEEMEELSAGQSRQGAIPEAAPAEPVQEEMPDMAADGPVAIPAPALLPEDQAAVRPMPLTL